MKDERAYHVDWFVDRIAHPDVTLRIAGGHLQSVSAARAADAIHLEGVVAVSGLVNAHTHLEFSSLKTPIPTVGRFTDWIRAVVAHRRQNPTNVSDAIREGIRECFESGTTQIGEIATVGWSFEDFDQHSFHGVVFQELLGLTSERIAEQQSIAQSHTNNRAASPVVGISPHAPYSTHLELVDESVRLANETGCPIAMHLAETQAELELLAAGSGEFREMLQSFGIWRDELFPGGRRPLDYLKRLSQASRSLIVHGNYLDEEELNYIADHPQMTLVYCPRTHAAFGHAQHPWRRLLELGGHVALGTDSRASNPDLSLFAELQFLAQRHPDLSHIDLLALGSAAGSRALGMREPNRADFTFIQLLNGSIQDPSRELFTAGHRPCGTMIAGQWAWLADNICDQQTPETN